MAELRVDVLDGPFAGSEAVLSSQMGDRVLVQVNVFGRRVPVELPADQVRIPGTGAGPEAADVAGGADDRHERTRAHIVLAHDRLAEWKALGFFLDRVDAPEADPAAEWDAYLVHRDQAQERAEARKQAVLERFDQELAARPADEARQVVDADSDYWLAGRPAPVEEPAPERDRDAERLLAAIFGHEVEEDPPVDRAKERRERARAAAEDRDYEQWEAGRSVEERRAGPSRGNPGRYAYARADRSAAGQPEQPEENAVELAIRSQAGLSEGPIPADVLTSLRGLRLDLRRPVNLSPLAHLPNLRWLSVRSTVPVDVAALASVLAPAWKLRSLTIEAPIDDIAPLAQLTQVLDLTLHGTRITDITPLAAATQLRDLSICDGPIEDLTPLAGHHLRRLFVYRTRVRDLSPLAGMPTLQVLGLVACPVRDLSVVTTLPALHSVNLSGTGIADLGDLPQRVPRVTFDGVGEPPRVPFDAVALMPTAGPLADEPAATLLAEHRAAAEDNWSRQGQLKRAMLAARRLDLVQQLVVEGDGGTTSAAGLLLHDGVGDVPFPGNPWDIPVDSDLAFALSRIWAPVANLAPRFVAAVFERTLALTLLTRDDGTPALGYLVWHRDDDGGRLIPAPDSLERFADPALDYHLSLVVGAAPHHADPTARVPLLAGPAPRPIRDFWAIHHSLHRRYGYGIGGTLHENALEFFRGDRWSVAAQRLGGLPPDRFVLSLGRTDHDAYVLDLDVLDSTGNPTVATWAFKEWEVSDHKPFWDWLDSTGIELVFGP